VRLVAALLLAGVTVAAAAPSPDDLALYARWCARCHGDRGDGRGPAAAALAFNGRAPRDFTRGLFRFKSTPTGRAPTDDDLRRTILRGIPGTSMPYFADLLRADEVDRLVGVVRSFARTPPPPAVPIDLGPPPPDDPARRTHGAALYVSLGCPACHGAAGVGDGPAAAALRNDDRTSAVPSDLRRPWAFRGGSEPTDVVLRLATGLAGTPMPSYLDAAPLDDLWSVAYHLRSIALAPSLRAAAVAAARAEPGAGEAPAARGEYLAKAGTCFLCHVRMQEDGTYDATSFGAGGMRVEIAHVGRFFTRNLTSDPETGLGAWSADDLRRALRTGRSRNGRALSALEMPWTILADLTDRDVEALHAFLRTLPPARNLVPPPEAPPLAGQVPGMLRFFLTGTQTGAAYHPGDAGRVPDEPAAPDVDNPRQPVVVLAAALVVSAVGLLVGFRTRRALGAALAVVAIGIAFVHTWPPLRFMPPALVRGAPPFTRIAALLGLPPVRPPPPPRATGDADTDALAARGRYVATAGTCSLCHTAGPNVTRLWQRFPDMGGGMRVAWRVFGTTYSRNLTPDPETGLGAWSDAEIRRAVTSGLARDGRTMHWQAMPWDHFSHLRPEDLEALVAYLRALPPARSRVPPPSPPTAGDPAGDTFFFGYTGEYDPQ
jgi:mono/diheme cytochrome c family protein